jgi:hypothetical protein
MEKRILRFPVTKVHALPGFDDVYLHMRTQREDGNHKAGWVHFQGFHYPKELRDAKNAVVSIEFELKTK